jgi:hypothetical protein
MKSVSLLLRVTYRGADWLETKSHSSHDQCELGALETCKGGPQDLCRLRASRETNWMG